MDAGSVSVTTAATAAAVSDISSAAAAAAAVYPADRLKLECCVVSQQRRC